MQYPEDSLVAEIFDLFWQIYQKGKTKFERLTPEFFRLIVREDMSHFIMPRVSETGTLIAFMLCFCVGTWVIDKYISLDYTVARDWYLHFRLQETVVKWQLLPVHPSYKAARPTTRQNLILAIRLFR